MDSLRAHLRAEIRYRVVDLHTESFEYDLPLGIGRWDNT